MAWAWRELASAPQAPRGGEERLGFGQGDGSVSGEIWGSLSGRTIRDVVRTCVDSESTGRDHHGR